MAWVQWDNETDQFRGTLRHIPDALEGRPASVLATLGIRELVTVQPENFIPRFSGLSGRSEFTRLADGRVQQTFPEADFSVGKVRTELVRMVKEAATRELSKTDWYFTRQLELGSEVPAAVRTLRGKIRDHVEWIENDIEQTAPRALVEYAYSFPVDADQVMINGTPVWLAPGAPTELPLRLATPPQDVHTGEGFDPDADGVFGDDLVDPAPPPPPAPVPSTPPATTDAEVPIYHFTDPDTPVPVLDAEGFPLVTAYAPTVEDTGPLPDQQ